MYKIQSPQPQKPTHPHQARWKVVSHPPPQRTLEGSLQYCFLTWLHVEITQGEPGEILMPGSYPQRFRQKWPGVWTGN